MGGPGSVRDGSVWLSLWRERGDDFGFELLEWYDRNAGKPLSQWASTSLRRTLIVSRKLSHPRSCGLREQSPASCGC